MEVKKNAQDVTNETFEFIHLVLLLDSAKKLLAYDFLLISGRKLFDLLIHISI